MENILKNRMKTGLTFLVIILIIFIFYAVYFKGFADQTVYLQTDVTQVNLANLASISELNGLYYAKPHYYQADMYGTAYGGQILQLFDLQFTEETYNWIYSLQQSDGVFSCTYFDDPILCTYFTFLALEGRYKKSSDLSFSAEFLLDYLQEDFSFMYQEETGDEGVVSEQVLQTKIISTYMAVYVMKQVGVEFDFANTELWLKELLQQEHVYKNPMLFAKVIKTLAILNPNEYATKWNHNHPFSQEYLEGILQQEAWDIEEISYVEALADLQELGILYVSTEQVENVIEKIVQNLLTPIQDLQTKYQLLNIYFKFGGNHDIQEIWEVVYEIKKKELPNGGISSIGYLGTARETIMVLQIKRLLKHSTTDDYMISSALKDTLIEYINEQRMTEPAEIYSAIGSLQILNQLMLSKSEQGKLIDLLKDYLGTEIYASNLRDWFYAVKTLELLGYSFVNQDLPKNYYLLISNVTDQGYINFGSEQNSIFTAIFVDGILTIKPKNQEMNRFIIPLERLALTDINDPLYLTQVYYSTFALSKLGKEVKHMDQVRLALEALRVTDGFKSNQFEEYSNLFATHQALLISYLGEYKNDFYR